MFLTGTIDDTLCSAKYEVSRPIAKTQVYRYTTNCLPRRSLLQYDPQIFLKKITQHTVNLRPIEVELIIIRKPSYANLKLNLTLIPLTICKMFWRNSIMLHNSWKSRNNVR